MKGTRARLAEIARRLSGRFGTPESCGHAIPPLDNLVLTILSQNTNDANRDRAFASLKRKFPTISRLAAAEPGELEEAIRAGGLAKTKAASILSALARIEAERGRYTLDFLRGMPLPEARAYLTSFGGVGVKTANILLLFSFGLPAFPVDTHILRVTKRLGLVPANATLAKAAGILEPHVPGGAHASLHLHLIRLGRELCRPRNPLCPSCPLLSLCPAAKSSAFLGTRFPRECTHGKTAASRPRADQRHRRRHIGKRPQDPGERWAGPGGEGRSRRLPGAVDPRLSS